MVIKLLAHKVKIKGVFDRLYCSMAVLIEGLRGPGHRPILCLPKLFSRVDPPYLAVLSPYPPLLFLLFSQEDDQSIHVFNIG